MLAPALAQAIETVSAEAPAAHASPLGLPALLALFVVGSLLVVAWSRWVRPMNLALGYGATVAMWTLSYVAMLQPGLAAGELLFAGALACVFCAGFLAGRRSNGQASGLSVGLVSATINLMVIGAFLRDEQGGSSLTAPIYVAGLFLASGALGAAGEWMGRRGAHGKPLPAPATVLGAVAAANILVMIVLGGLVTSYEAGLAVPDWPNSFGHNMLLYPVAEMRGGIFYEHAHRLFGMLVGATVLSYATIAWSTRRAAETRWTAVALVSLVVVQGILGGLRVTGAFTASMDASDLSPDTQTGIVHGMLGQAIFALAVVSAATTTDAWRRAVGSVPGARWMRTLTLAALAALGVQLFLGTAMRHLQTPPTGESGARIPAWALHGHITMALLAFLVVFVAGNRCRRASTQPVLRIPGTGVMHAVGLQVLLGVAALVAVLLRRGESVPWWEAISTTSHQALGAILLALVAMLAVAARRVTATA
jgi:cytochrome c oxidase assembly protein subunit 15